MTALMRESPPARFMFGIRMSGYVPTATESELLAKWKALEERAQQAELFAAFRKAVED